MFPNDMPWYKSRIIIGAIVSIVMKLLVATGLLGEIGLDDGAVTDAVLLVVGGAADLWIMYSRATQKAAPVLTK